MASKPRQTRQTRVELGPNIICGRGHTVRRGYGGEHGLFRCRYRYGGRAAISECGELFYALRLTPAPTHADQLHEWRLRELDASRLWLAVDITERESIQIGALGLSPDRVVEYLGIEPHVRAALSRAA